MRRRASIDWLGRGAAGAQLDQTVDEEATLLERFVGEGAKERANVDEDLVEGILVAVRQDLRQIGRGRPKDFDHPLGVGIEHLDRPVEVRRLSEMSAGHIGFEKVGRRGEAKRFFERRARAAQRHSEHLCLEVVQAPGQSPSSSRGRPGSLR